MFSCDNFSAPSESQICEGLPWSAWTANSDKKLNVNKLCVTSRKKAFRKFCKIFCQFSRCHKLW